MVGNPGYQVPRPFAPSGPVTALRDAGEATELQGIGLDSKSLRRTLFFHPLWESPFPRTPKTAAPPPTGDVWTLPGPRSSPSPAGGSGPLPHLGALTSPANLYPRASAATNRENKQTPARGGERARPRPRPAPRLSHRPRRRDFPPALGS